MRLSESKFEDVERVRERLGAGAHSSVCHAAQDLAEDLATRFTSIVLARLFVVVPFKALPEGDRAFARGLVGGDARLSDDTRVLSLLGTSGREPDWCDRARSRGHPAVPLLDRAHVRGIPMLARLLGDLEADLAGLDQKRSIASTPMLGGHNAKFLIPDASHTTNADGQLVIPATDFVAKHGVRTVFGMGGSYVDGTLAVAIVFADEVVDPLIVARFPSLISSFKMATSNALTSGRVYPA